MSVSDLQPPSKTCKDLPQLTFINTDAWLSDAASSQKYPVLQDGTLSFRWEPCAVSGLCKLWPGYCVHPHSQGVLLPGLTRSSAHQSQCLPSSSQ